MSARRRFRSVPEKILETMLRMRCLRTYHVEARAELITRRVAREIALASPGESGPWAVAPPEGMH